MVYVQFIYTFAPTIVPFWDRFISTKIILQSAFQMHKDVKIYIQPNLYKY